MKRGDKVFVFPKQSVNNGDWAAVEIASENKNSLALVDGEGRTLILLRDETTQPFWRDIFTDRLYGVSVESGIK